MHTIETTTLLPCEDEIKLQPASLDIWDKKYRLRTQTGEAVDQSVDATYQRIARAISDAEDTATLREYWYRRFLWAIRQGAVPAGRILSNAGAGEHKPKTSTINCTVSGAIGDSMQEILHATVDAGMTLKAGCGIGYDFSTLRPKGAHVSGAGATTSGPLPFMDIFDRVCATVSSAGARRGAQMATFDIQHPDVEEFIRAKREDGRLRNFNLSLLVTDQFMAAVEADADWPLAFPHRSGEPWEETKIIWREWPLHDPEYTIRPDGQVACRIYRTVRARALMDLVMQSTYDYAEPGFILIDRVNQMNNNWWCEDIRATNPCGEQPLPPNGSCLLGSINLTRFVRDPFSQSASFDFEGFAEVVRVFTRMLDNVVELNGLALAAQREEIERKRRHGMGFLGLGSAMCMLRMRYGSPDSVAFTEKVTQCMAVEGWLTGVELAKEKGPAPILKGDTHVTVEMLRLRPEMADAGIQAGDMIPTRELFARYSRYMQKLATVAPDLVDAIAKHGVRFTHHTSIAPTGTIALSVGNNASNGIEPSFAHQYGRNIIRTGRKTKEHVQVQSYELLAYRWHVNPTASPDAQEGSDRLPSYFVSSDEISTTEHLAVQAAAQHWVDSAISKTINVPTDMPFKAFQDIYLQAHRLGLKGCTTFRFNPTAFQGVLVKAPELAQTTYSFELEDGKVITARGDELIEYDGEQHTAANLHDALKEGTYGKY